MQKKQFFLLNMHLAFECALHAEESWVTAFVHEIRIFSGKKYIIFYNIFALMFQC